MGIKKRKLQDIQKSMPTEKTRAAKYKWKVKVKYKTKLTCRTQGLKKQHIMKNGPKKGGTTNRIKFI